MGPRLDIKAYAHTVLWCARYVLPIQPHTYLNVHVVCYFDPPPLWMRSIAMSISVYLYVCSLVTVIRSSPNDVSCMICTSDALSCRALSSWIRSASTTCCSVTT